MESDLSPQDAQAALAVVHSARTSLADRMVTPWWYHPVLGLLLGGLIAVQAVPWVLLQAAYLLFYLLGILLLAKSYRRCTGVWVSGMRPGRARRWAFGLTVVVVLLFAGSFILHQVTDWEAAPLTAGALIVPLTIFCGRRYDVALRADLRRR